MCLKYGCFRCFPLIPKANNRIVLSCRDLISHLRSDVIAKDGRIRQLESMAQTRPMSREKLPPMMADMLSPVEEKPYGSAPSGSYGSRPTSQQVCPGFRLAVYFGTLW